MSVTEHYEEVADTYDQELNKYCQDRFLKKIQQHAKGKILDVGCATGFLQKHFSNIIGIDLTHKLLKQNKNPSICANAEKMPFKNESFDVVYSINLLEHAKKPDHVVAECARVSKKGGKIILVTPNKGMELVLDLAEKLKLKIPEGEHRFLSHKEMEKMCKESGLSIVNNKKIILMPFHIPLISSLLEKVEPIFQPFCFFHCFVCEK